MMHCIYHQCLWSCSLDSKRGLGASSGVIFFNVGGLKKGGRTSVSFVGETSPFTSALEIENKNEIKTKSGMAHLPMEGGLVKKGGGFREGAHTAHGNHRPKTICWKNIGVFAFDPHGPSPLP
jgi:hypothetical protein